MTSMIANLLVNTLMVVLLLVTIGYCWLLNKRIKVLQDSKSELALLLRHFDESTQRASESIIALQTASKKIGENIQMRIDKANYLVDDLSFMIDKGNKITNQIEAGFAVQRARSRIVAATHAPEDEMDMETDEGMPEEKPAPMQMTPPMEKPTSREKTVSSLEAVLERVVNRSKIVSPKQQHEEETPQAARPVPTASQARSRSEQELLDMIKSGLKG